MEHISKLVTNSAVNSKPRQQRVSESAIAPARLAAYRILKRVDEEGAFATVLLATQKDLSDLDRAFCYELTMGVLRWQLLLDHLISHYANRRVDRLDAAVRRVLRLGLYQLRFMDRVPQSAAVNEAVKLVRFARVRSADTFVNAVLRRAIREADFDPSQTTGDPFERISIETSHPLWLIKRWSENFGQENAAALAMANNHPAPVSFRITTAESETKHILAHLKENGANLVRSLIAGDAWRVSGATQVTHRLAEEGHIYIQDEASQLVGQLVAPLPGQSVLDMCAGPGSKTTHLAHLANGRALVVAGDIHAHRLGLVRQAVRGQRLSGVHCVVLDGEAAPFLPAAFDRILVDAPCSGTGTLRRNPEIRWRISPENVRELSNHQKLLLRSAAHGVKPGGRLVYSTCSIEPDENEDVATDFLERHKSFVRLEPPVDPQLLTETGWVRTWPHRQGTDGFFVAMFERKRPDRGIPNELKGLRSL